MGPEPSSKGETCERTVDLVRELESLKRGGSNLLVVGSDVHSAHSTACTQLLGDATATPRRRLFVLTGRRDCRDRLRESPADPIEEYVRVIRRETATRGATAVQGQPSTWRPTPPETIVDDGTLSALGIAIHEQLDAFEATADGLEPAELRLCLDSIAPLLEAHGAESVFRFLHLVTNRVRAARGMGHFHLPTERDDAFARQLAPLFDATVELAPDERDVKQRWHLRDSGLSTDWLRL